MRRLFVCHSVLVAVLVVLCCLSGSCDRAAIWSGWDPKQLSSASFAELAASPQSEKGKELEAFVGSRARLVWAKSVKGSADDIFHLKDWHVLYGLGSRHSEGIRVIAEGPSTFRKPLISPDGNWVVYTETDSMSTWRVPFVGGIPEKLGSGFALCFWTDPGTGEDWLYVGEDCIRAGSNIHAQRVVRRRLWDLEAERVWDASPVTVDSFTVSADGGQALAGLPWPDIGVANFKEASWDKMEIGCWPSFLPEMEGISAVFDGAHRNLKMSSLEPPRRWVIPLSAHPDLVAAEVYHPMWSTRYNFLAFSGPYRNSHDKDHASIFQGGEDIEIYLARLHPDLSSVEEVLTITDDAQADFSPYLWIAPRADSPPEKDAILADKPTWERLGDQWPLVGDRTLLLWRGFHDDNAVADPNGETPRRVVLSREGMALPGIAHELVSAGGIGRTTGGDDLTRALRDLVASEAGGAVELGFKHIQNSAGVMLQLGSFLKLTVADNSLHIHRGDQLITEPIPLRDGPPHHLVLNLLPDGTGGLIFDDLELGAVAAMPALASVPIKDEENLQFGDGSWYGTIHRFAIHGRPLDLDEATGNRISMRDQMAYLQPPELLTPRARLVQLATIPTPEALGAYQDGLTMGRYVVVKGSASVKVGATIDVAHWAVIDREVNPAVQELKVGETYDLVIEDFSFHPELSSQRIESFSDLQPLYYDRSWHSPRNPSAQ